MSLSSPLSTRAWIAVPLLAVVFLFWSNSDRRERIEYVTRVVPGDAVVSTASPTGYAGGVRDLVLLEQNYDASHWIAQTQQMLADDEWRVRHIAYENAPVGRAVFTPSPYRWWLGLVAWIDHAISGRPIGLSVERAALYADPLLHLLLLGMAVTFTAWRFGAVSAALLSLAVAGLFPFAAGYQPGVPDGNALSRASTLCSMLLLLAGARSVRSTRQWFFGAGVMGAFGLWLNVADHVPVILGIAAGAMLAAWVLRREISSDAARIVSPVNWLFWSIGGASGGLIFYLIEYSPSHLASWRLEGIDPLYSLAWLGLGAGLAVGVAWFRRDGSVGRTRGWMGAAFAVTSLAVVPLLMWETGDAGFLATNAWSFRLTTIPGGAEATNLWTWWVRDGFSPMMLATLLPVLLIAPAIWLMLRSAGSPISRASVAMAVGPVVVVMGFACWQIGRWSGFDAALLALLVVVTLALREEIKARVAVWIWSGGVGAVLALGISQLLPPSGSPDKTPLNESELSSLIVRDIAHWLAKRTDAKNTVVLAPPSETMALSYYGGLPGIGTLSWENQAGLAAAARIFSATSLQEALARIEQRKVTHIVVPSWDRHLDEYVRLNDVQLDYAFLSGLRNWALIPWLRPLSYQLPAIPGYEGRSVAIFEVVEEQSEATLLSWQAEYFAEMGRLDYAAAIAASLQRFPNDLGALIARAQVAMSRRDGAALAEVVKTLASRVTAGSDRFLPWDRRVGLAVVLAQGNQTELARAQVRRCVADLNEERLRSISTGSLYQLLALARLFEVELSDVRLRELARDLLPAEWRTRV